MRTTHSVGSGHGHHQSRFGQSIPVSPFDVKKTTQARPLLFFFFFFIKPIVATHLQRTTNNHTISNQIWPANIPQPPAISWYSNSRREQLPKMRPGGVRNTVDRLDRPSAYYNSRVCSSSSFTRAKRRRMRVNKGKKKANGMIEKPET